MPLKWRIQTELITVADSAGNSVEFPDYGSLTIDELEFLDRAQRAHSNDGLALLLDSVTFCLRSRLGESPELAWEALRAVEKSAANALDLIKENRSFLPPNMPKDLLQAIFNRLVYGDDRQEKTKPVEVAKEAKKSTGAKSIGGSKPTTQMIDDSTATILDVAPAA